MKKLQMVYPQKRGIDYLFEKVIPVLEKIGYKENRGGKNWRILEDPNGDEIKIFKQVRANIRHLIIQEYYTNKE